MSNNFNLRRQFKIKIKRIAGIGTAILLFSSPRSQAQITFNASDLPHTIGQSFQEYITTNVNPSGMLGSAGALQVWDFSQPGDYLRTIAIVSPTNGNHQASFPGATYAEYFLDGVSIFDGELDYYSVDTNAGQVYYGSYNPQSGANAFSPPYADIPAVVEFGSSWTNNSSTALSPFTFDDTITSTVDAYGTIILPRIGPFQALRVNQLTEEDELYDSIPVGTFYVREYFWLVPGIGEAVDIVSTDASAPPDENFTSAAEVRIVFPEAITNLEIRLQGNSASLTWPVATNPPGYQVQMISNLSSTNWQVLASPATNSWSDPLTATQRFYRVFVQP